MKKRKCYLSHDAILRLNDHKIEGVKSKYVIELFEEDIPNEHGNVTPVEGLGIF